MKINLPPNLFCLIGKRIFITSHNTAYPVSAFYKSLHPNATHFGYADMLNEINFYLYGQSKSYALDHEENLTFLIFKRGKNMKNKKTIFIIASIFINYLLMDRKS